MHYIWIHTLQVLNSYTWIHLLINSCIHFKYDFVQTVNWSLQTMILYDHFMYDFICSMNSFMNFGVARFQSSKFPPTSWLNVVGWVPTCKFRLWLISRAVIRPVLSGVLTLSCHLLAITRQIKSAAAESDSDAAVPLVTVQAAVSCSGLRLRVGLRHIAQTRPRPLSHSRQAGSHIRVGLGLPAWVPPWPGQRATDLPSPRLRVITGMIIAPGAQA